jgi:hypothetical protein
MDFYMLMFITKISDPFSFMPTGTIYLQISNFILKTPAEMGEKFFKTICIAFFVLHYALSTIYRIHPTRNIYSFLLLAACINTGCSLPFLNQTLPSLKVWCFFLGRIKLPQAKARVHFF